MRPVSLILAFAFVLAGSFMPGSADTSLPGPGAFSYGGSPATVIAGLTVARRS